MRVKDVQHTLDLPTYLTTFYALLDFWRTRAEQAWGAKSTCAPRGSAFFAYSLIKAFERCRISDTAIMRWDNSLVSRRPATRYAITLVALSFFGSVYFPFFVSLQRILIFYCIFNSLSSSIPLIRTWIVRRFWWNLVFFDSMHSKLQSPLKALQNKIVVIHTVRTA